MKVLKSPDMTWEAESECKTCGALLLVEMKDMRYDQNRDKFYSQCAVCSAVLYPSHALPWFVKRAASGGRVQF